MTPEENIAAINAELSAARAKLANLLAQKTANEARTAQWLDKVRRMGPASDSDAALASCAADKISIASQLTSVNEQIAQLTTQLDNAMKAKDAQDAAHAKAISEGLSGEAAVERAKGIVAGEKAKTTAIIIAAIVVGALALFWGWRKFIKKKA